MNLHNIVRMTGKALKDNSPSILTAFGVTGTITTAYLASKASFKAAETIRFEQAYLASKDKDTHLDYKEKTKLVWKLYIPAAVSGVLTIGCTISSTRIGSRKAAALTAVYSLTEKAFSEYKEKVVETLGENKERAIRDELAQDKVTKNPPPHQYREVIISGPGNVLCCELFTGRYFNSDMETIRKAANDVNEKIIHEMYVTLSFFYYLIGLPYTSYSSEIGWDSDRLMELQFSTVLTDDGRPCLAFEYNHTKTL